jgi:hypothetical protein
MFTPIRCCVLLLCMLSLIGCASAPAPRGLGIQSTVPLEVIKAERSQRIELYARAEVLNGAQSAALPQVEIADGAHDQTITDEQAALVANRAAREVCRNLAARMALTEDSAAADLRIALMITDIRPTSAGAAGASAAIGVAVPGPFRLPTGLGGLAADGAAYRGADTVLLKRWAKGANAVMDDAKVSAIGDAYQLADRFADSFTDTLLKPDATPRRARLNETERARNQALCDARFGRASVAGRGASFVLPLAPEAIDAGAPPPADPISAPSFDEDQAER